MQINKKAICLLILVIAAVFTTQAQRPRFRPQVHELGLQIGSMHAAFEVEGLQTTWANGLRYSYHIDKSKALRAGLFYRRGVFSNPNSISSDLYPFTAEQNAFELRLGYMVKYHIYRLQLYAGIDAIGRYTRMDESFVRGLGFAPNKQNFFGLGASALVGAQMFANKHVSLGVEADVYAIIQNRRESDPSNPNPPLPGLFIDREMGSNMVSVYLAFHFKRLKKSCTCGKPGS